MTLLTFLPYHWWPLTYSSGILKLLFSKCQIRIVEHFEVPNIAKRAERPYGWGPGARLRAPVGSRGGAPGGGPGGGAPGSSWVLAVFRWKRMGLWACFDTVFNYFNIQILHFTMVKNIKLKGSQQLDISKKVSLLTSAALMTEVAPWIHCQCCEIRLVLSDFLDFFFFFFFILFIFYFF